MRLVRRAMSLECILQARLQAALVSASGAGTWVPYGLSAKGSWSEKAILADTLWDGQPAASLCCYTDFQG